MNRLKQVLEDIERLEPFPISAIRVFELANNGAEPEHIVAEIERDPGLTSKVLKLSNSVRYAPQVPIDSILGATNRLGTRAVASLVMTSGCASYFMGYGSSTRGSNLSLWRECLHTALVARHLAPRLRFDKAELAYTVGLLQNIGHIVLDRFLEQERDEVLALVDRGAKILEAEQRILGIDHAACGERIARKWGFPETLSQGIRFHHCPSLAGEWEGLCGVAEFAEWITSESVVEGGTSLLEGCVAPAARVLLGAAELDSLVREVSAELSQSDGLLT